jgi:hypothetical protein
MESQWQGVRSVLAAVADGSRARLSPADEVQLDAFAGLYAGHIEAEEQFAYPAARPLLAGPPMEAMTRDMMARRGVVGS